MNQHSTDTMDKVFSSLITRTMQCIVEYRARKDFLRSYMQ